jgi:putative DNA primase/helicase
MLEKPEALPVDFEEVPADLARLDQWVLWRYEWRDGRWTKPPYAVGGGPASSTDPATWAPFADVKAAYLDGDWDGVGLVHLPENELTGVDIDHCRDPATGALTPEAAAAVKALDTYAEASPSGAGVRAYAFARKPGPRCKSGALRGFEVYDGVTAEGNPGGRYLTVTGNLLGGCPPAVNHRQEQVEALYRELFGEPGCRHGGNGAAGDLGDDEIIRLLGAAENAAKFRALWEGDAGGYGSPSEADQALCALIAFYTKDPQQIERVFSRSALARRAKWNGRADYRARTAAAAAEFVKEQYQGGGGGDPHRTDRGNAVRLARGHGGDLRHCHPWHAWLAWDGCRWRPDDSGEATRRAKRVPADLFEWAAAEIRKLHKQEDNP